MACKSLVRDCRHNGILTAKPLFSGNCSSNRDGAHEA